MDNEREDATQKQFDNAEIQGEGAGGGYPEEQPGGAGGGRDPSDRSGAEPVEPEDSPAGSSGEGTQSTGDPRGAG